MTLQSKSTQRAPGSPARASIGIRLLRCCLLLAALMAHAYAQDVESPFEMEKIIGGNGTELAVYETGNPNGPEIVFIHGLMGSHLAWINQLTGVLAQQYRLIAIDIRGHANSDKPLDSEAYTRSRLWAEDIHAVLEAKSLNNPVLVGWSYGPRLIKDYIRYFGESRLAGVVLVSSAPIMAGTDEEFALYGGGMLALFEDLLSADEQTRLQATKAFLTDLLTAEPLDESTFELVRDIAMLVPPEARVGMFSRQLDNSDIVSAMTTPALIIHGQADQVVHPEASGDLFQQIEQAELITYPAAGHAPFLEDPARFDADLQSFMRSLSPPLKGLSGGWSDPATSGQGWSFVAAPNGLFGYYFGYGGNGEQIWAITAEVIDDIEADVPVNFSLLRGIGGGFGTPVAPSDLVSFGEVSLTFHDCHRATAEIATEFGSEIQHLEKFASIHSDDGCGLRIP